MSGFDPFTIPPDASPEDADRLKKREALRQAYAAVFTGPDGTAVLNDLIVEGGLLIVATVPGDAAMTHFNDGRRSLVLHVLDQLRWGATDVAAHARARQAARPAQLTEMTDEA